MEEMIFDPGALGLGDIAAFDEHDAYGCENLVQVAPDRLLVPLLSAGDTTTRLQDLMELRAPLYAEIADIIIPTDGRRVPGVAEHILRELAAASAPR